MSAYSAHIQRINEVTRQAEALVKTLDPSMLYISPQAGTWSVGEILQHLITSNGLYHEGWEARLAGKHSKSMWEILPGQSFWGKMLKDMMARTEKKYKHPEAFTPIVSHGDLDILEKFIESQNKLVYYFEKLAALPADTTMASPGGAFITYTLADCVEIITAHEERHLRQIRIAIDAIDGMKAA